MLPFGDIIKYLDLFFQCFLRGCTPHSFVGLPGPHPAFMWGCTPHALPGLSGPRFPGATRPAQAAFSWPCGPIHLAGPAVTFQSIEK